METSVDNGIADDALRTLLQDALGLKAPLNTRIHGNDQMFTFIASARGSEGLALSDYFTSGAQMTRILGQLVRWKFGSFDNVGSLLDFAGGYGRVTRFLVHDMPAERIWVSDIQADAVDFQKAEFGVNGFVSTADPADLVCDRTFDCIFVASLFSHLPGATFRAWLKKLYSLLKPGGLLAFSLNDESRIPPGETMPESGIWFGEASEIDSLDTKQYGVTMVTQAFARQSILDATGRPEYHRIPYGLAYQQDLYLVANEPAPDFSNLHFAYLPHGTIDNGRWTAPGRLFLRGWAINISSEGQGELPEVQIFTDGRLTERTTPSTPRPDVREHFKDDRFFTAGWECSLAFASSDSTQPILVKGVSSAGKESLLYAGPVGSVLPVGKAEACFWIRPGELYVKGWAVDPSGEGAPVEVQIFVNGQLVCKVTPGIYRPELYEHFSDDAFLRAGWEGSFQLAGATPGEVIVVKSVSEDGAEWSLYRGTIIALEAQGNEALGQQVAALTRLENDLHKRLEYIQHLEAEIARKNVALAELEAHMRRPPWQRLIRR